MEIEWMNGDNKVIRNEIVMEIGERMKKEIDVGKVEGGLIKGYGMLKLEEMV